MLLVQGGGLLRGPLMRPSFRRETGGDNRPHRLARMRGLPLGLEAFQVLADLLTALAHHRVEPLELSDLTGHGIESEAVPIQRLGKLGMRSDHGSAEGTDRALLLEQRRRIQSTPLPGRSHAGADLEMDMPMRITRTAGSMRHGHGLHLANGHDLLLPTRPDTRHGVQSDPALNLRHRILLRRVQGSRDRRVQGGGDRQRFRRVDDHLREPRRPLLPDTRQTRCAHRLTRDRVRPVHPPGIGLRVEPESSGDVALPIESRELRDGSVVAEIVVVGAGTVGLDIAARVGSGSPEQDHAAMHANHRLMFLIQQL